MKEKIHASQPGMRPGHRPCTRACPLCDEHSRRSDTQTRVHSRRLTATGLPTVLSAMVLTRNAQFRVQTKSQWTRSIAAAVLGHTRLCGAVPDGVGSEFHWVSLRLSPTQKRSAGGSVWHARNPPGLAALSWPVWGIIIHSAPWLFRWGWGTLLRHLIQVTFPWLRRQPDWISYCGQTCLPLACF